MLFLRTEKDFSVSVEKALDEIDKDWRDYEGLIISGTHSPDIIDEKLEALKEAREKGTPALGICFGMQLMVIEYARSMGLNANTTEIEETEHPVIHKLPKLRVGIFKVDWPTFGSRMESHWHNYAFN